VHLTYTALVFDVRQRAVIRHLIDEFMVE